MCCWRHLLYLQGKKLYQRIDSNPLEWKFRIWIPSIPLLQKAYCRKIDQRIYLAINGWHWQRINVSLHPSGSRTLDIWNLIPRGLLSETFNHMSYRGKFINFDLVTSRVTSLPSTLSPVPLTCLLCWTLWDGLKWQIRSLKLSPLKMVRKALVSFRLLDRIFPFRAAYTRHRPAYYYLTRFIYSPSRCQCCSSSSLLWFIASFLNGPYWTRKARRICQTRWSRKLLHFFIHDSF